MCVYTCRYRPRVRATSGRDLRCRVHVGVQGSTPGGLGRPHDSVRVTQARCRSQQGPTTQRLTSVLADRLPQETLCESTPYTVHRFSLVVSLIAGHSYWCRTQRLGGVTLRTLDLRSKSREFDSRPGRYRVSNTWMGQVNHLGIITNTKVSSAFYTPVR